MANRDNRLASCYPCAYGDKFSGNTGNKVSNQPENLIWRGFGLLPLNPIYW